MALGASKDVSVAWRFARIGQPGAWFRRDAGFDLGGRRPEYRLRIGDAPVIHNGVPEEVRAVAVAAKEDAEEWLRRAGQ